MCDETVLFSNTIFLSSCMLLNNCLCMVSAFDLISAVVINGLGFFLELKRCRNLEKGF